MGRCTRVLPDAPVATLDEHRRRGGGRALSAARDADPDALVAEIVDSGLRGRGGAGFPTGRKWRTVAANRSPVEPTTVVVNGAEGEPGCLKDRSILRADPYSVLEGAVAAARAVGADGVIVALKETFTRELARVRAAVEEMRRAGWLDGVEVDVFAGPAEYLFGEETALLEAIDGRPPFPRIAPPYRRGVEEVVDDVAEIEGDSSSAAQVELAGPTGATIAPPALVDNVETLANVAWILAEGADRFREVGTDDTPGTMVCTVTGDVPRAGVAEMAMGTPLREVLETVSGVRAADVRAVLTGVSNPFLPADALDVPLGFGAFAAAGSGLGTAGFVVLGRGADLVAVAAGVARFLGIESCGQCTPCKRDGLDLAATLARLCRGEAHDHDRLRVADLAARVADSARCNLASQQQAVATSLLRLFPDDVRDHAGRTGASTEPALVAPLLDIVDGRAVVEERHARKQPDWSYDELDSGRTPAERFGDRRIPESRR